MKKFMKNKPLFWGVIGGAAALVIAAVVLILCLNSGDKGAPVDSCVITVKTEGGMVLENIGVEVYTDASKTDMLAYVKTDKEGKAPIGTQVPAGGVAVLKEVPTGYVVADSYPITQADTQIILKAELLKEMAPITLGGVMFDFTVTDTDGVSHTLSEMLKTKKAVVLNLWYTTCGPCKMEFPYLQEAYDSYSESIALLALNPYGSETEEQVKNFKNENNLTLPMAKVDAAWEQQVNGIAYPTTIIIDRFGTVGLIHVGAIDSVKTFTDAFAYFTADTYVQSIVTDIKSLEAEVVPGGEGTAESPLEFGGTTEFEVTVKPGQQVYCNVYKVSGMMMKIEDAAAVVTYNGIELKPENGVIETIVKAEDTFSPILLVIGSTATEEKTVKVTFYFLPGTLDNPYAVEGDTMDVKIAEGNEQGVYYMYKADQYGKLTLICTSATSGVNYDFALYNLNSYKMLTSAENGETVNGKKALTIDVSAGDEVQIIVSTLPNEENAYPAADFKFALSFEKGEAPSGGSQGGSQGGALSGSQSGSQGGAQGGSQGGSTGGAQGGTTGGSQGGTLSGEYTDIYDGEIRAYHVSTGDTVFTPVSGAINYFLFEPTEAGQYSFTISDGKVIYYGNNLHFVNAMESTGMGKNKSLTENIVKGSIGSQFLLGIETSVSSATLTIKRVGNSIEEKPFTVYNGLSKPTSQYTYTGGTLSVVDITGPTIQVVKGSDGYYHWGSASGPVVYVKLNDKTDSRGYLSFDEWLNSERPVIKTAVGSGSSEKRWDFTSCMSTYNKYKDKSTGYYPLNDDLKFMLETLYEGQQWKNNIFTNVSGLNEDMAWMFCCYYQK